MGDRPVDARDISRSVVVTGDGNNVTLTFRQDLLAELKAWLDVDDDISVQKIDRDPAAKGEWMRSRPILVRSPNQFPIISRFRQINSRFGQINSRFRLTGIGVQEIDQKRYF